MKALPFPGVTGHSRRARWRRHLLRRVAAALMVCSALLLVVHEVRPPPEPSTAVVVAVHPVAAGSELAPGDLGVVRVPSAQVQPGAIREPATLVGRRIGSALAAGESITRTRLVPRSLADGLASSRTVLHVRAADPVSVGLLHVGQRVAVYPVIGGKALTSDAEVLSTDPEATVDAFTAGQAPARGVVLAVASTDVERLLASGQDADGPALVQVVGLG